MSNWSCFPPKCEVLKCAKLYFYAVHIMCFLEISAGDTVEQEEKMLESRQHKETCWKAVDIRKTGKLESSKEETSWTVVSRRKTSWTVVSRRKTSLTVVVS